MWAMSAEQVTDETGRGDLILRTISNLCVALFSV